MWIMSVDGFYSVVAHRDNSGWVLVRARAKKDLVKLCARIDNAYPDDEEAHGRIREVRPSDYEYRVWVRRDVMTEMLADMAFEIDYPNFKTAVGKVDPERSHVYHSVWSALTAIARGRWTGGYNRHPIMGSDWDRDLLLPGEKRQETTFKVPVMRDVGDGTTRTGRPVDPAISEQQRRIALGKDPGEPIKVADTKPFFKRRRKKGRRVRH